MDNTLVSNRNETLCKIIKMMFEKLSNVEKNQNNKMKEMKKIIEKCSNDKNEDLQRILSILIKQNERNSKRIRKLKKMRMSDHQAIELLKKQIEDKKEISF